MVVGKGLLASKFKEIKDENFIFLTSGVSDSSCCDNEEFNREMLLVKKSLLKYSGKIFIYFSTTSIFNKISPYTIHKENIEKIIINSKQDYYIFRIPQVIGIGGNTNNLSNFLRQSILKDFKITILNVKRSLIDIDDLFDIVHQIIVNYKCNKIYNLSEIECLPMIQICNYFYEILEKTPNYELSINTEKDFPKNSLEIDKVIQDITIEKKNYTKKLIQKYLNINK